MNQDFSGKRFIAIALLVLMAVLFFGLLSDEGSMPSLRISVEKVNFITISRTAGVGSGPIQLEQELARKLITHLTTQNAMDFPDGPDCAVLGPIEYQIRVVTKDKQLLICEADRALTQCFLSGDVTRSTVLMLNHDGQLFEAVCKLFPE